MTAATWYTSDHFGHDFCFFWVFPRDPNTETKKVGTRVVFKIRRLNTFKLFGSLGSFGFSWFLFGKVFRFYVVKSENSSEFVRFN